MLFLSKAKDLKNLIIFNLKQGAVKTDALLKAVRKDNPKATKQAFYLALRQLLAEKIVVKQGKEVAMNLLFIDSLQNFLNEVNQNYINQSKSGARPLLSGTDRLIYKFNNLFSLDNYLLHIFALIMAETPARSPFYFYNPFEWFLLENPETEQLYYDWLIKKGKTIFLVLGEEEPLNRLIIKNYSREKVIIAIDEKLKFKGNEFIIVFGDYLIISKIDPSIAEVINNLCRDSRLSPVEIGQKINVLIAGGLKAKVSIEKKSFESREI